MDTDGSLHDVDSADVNAYLRAAGGEDYSAKDFRTWMGTLMAAAGLAAVETPDSDREARSMLRAAMTIVGKRLGNTATVARNSYVHPVVVDAFLDGYHKLWEDVRYYQGWILMESAELGYSFAQFKEAVQTVCEAVIESAWTTRTAESKPLEPLPVEPGPDTFRSEQDQFLQDARDQLSPSPFTRAA